MAKKSENVSDAVVRPVFLGVSAAVVPPACKITAFVKARHLELVIHITGTGNGRGGWR